MAAEPGFEALFTGEKTVLRFGKSTQPAQRSMRALTGTVPVHARIEAGGYDSYL